MNLVSMYNVPVIYADIKPGDWVTITRIDEYFIHTELRDKEYNIGERFEVLRNIQCSLACNKCTTDHMLIIIRYDDRNSLGEYEMDLCGCTVVNK